MKVGWAFVNVVHVLSIALLHPREYGLGWRVYIFKDSDKPIFTMHHTCISSYLDLNRNSVDFTVHIYSLISQLPYCNCKVYTKFIHIISIYYSENVSSVC